jgi:hypothetical protein
MQPRQCASPSTTISLLAPAGPAALVEPGGRRVHGMGKTFMSECLKADKKS